MTRNRVTLIGEAKWTNRPLGSTILRELERYKLPALRQAGYKIGREPHIVLYSKAGFSSSLHDHARGDDLLHLVDGSDALALA